MYFIQECYVDIVDGEEQGFSLPLHTKTNRLEAESTYHSILASAAISAHAYHGAIMFDNEMFPLMNKSYQHLEEAEDGE